MKFGWLLVELTTASYKNSSTSAAMMPAIC